MNEPEDATDSPACPYCGERNAWLALGQWTCRSCAHGWTPGGRGDYTIYDNGGRSFDRYTVKLHEYGYWLGIGPTGNVPNGFCMALSPDEVVAGDHLGEIIPFKQMTEPAQRAVRKELEFAAELERRQNG